MRQTLPAADTNAQTPQEKRPWRRWAVHVAHGLQSLHAQGLAHPDLKPANVVISGAGKAVIIDISGWAGTHEYLAPEVRDVFNLSQLGLEVQVKNDCWALGRLFERMAFAAGLDGQDADGEVLEAAASGLMVHDPEKRMGIAEVVSLLQGAEVIHGDGRAGTLQEVSTGQRRRAKDWLRGRCHVSVAWSNPAGGYGVEEGYGRRLEAVKLHDRVSKTTCYVSTSRLPGSLSLRQHTVCWCCDYSYSVQSTSSGRNPPFDLLPCLDSARLEEHPPSQLNPPILICDHQAGPHAHSGHLPLPLTASMFHSFTTAAAMARIPFRASVLPLQMLWPDNHSRSLPYRAARPQAPSEIGWRSSRGQPGQVSAMTSIARCCRALGLRQY